MGSEDGLKVLGKDGKEKKISWITFRMDIHIHGEEGPGIRIVDPAKATLYALSEHCSTFIADKIAQLQALVDFVGSEPPIDATLLLSGSEIPACFPVPPLPGLGAAVAASGIFATKSKSTAKEEEAAQEDKPDTPPGP